MKALPRTDLPDRRVIAAPDADVLGRAHPEPTCVRSLIVQQVCGVKLVKECVELRVVEPEGILAVDGVGVGRATERHVADDDEEEDEEDEEDEEEEEEDEDEDEEEEE